jgi:hypothetical protein
MADESFIRTMRATLQGRIKASEAQTEKENREDGIVKAEAPVFWGELKAWLKKSIEQVNEGLPSEVITYAEGADRPLDEIVLSCFLGEKRGEIRVKFFGLFGGNISVTGKKVAWTFECCVEGRHSYWYEKSNEHERFTVEEMGKRILGAAAKL